MQCECRTGLVTAAVGIAAVGAGLYIAWQMDLFDTQRLKRRIRKKILMLERALEDADDYVSKHL